MLKPCVIMCMSKDLSGYQDALNKRILDMTSACTQCMCVSACPMPAQSDVDASAVRLITEVTSALANGIAVGTASPSGNALAWANVCSGTGNCISLSRAIEPAFYVVGEAWPNRHNPLKNAASARAVASSGWRGACGYYLACNCQNPRWNA